MFGVRSDYPIPFGNTRFMHIGFFFCDDPRSPCSSADCCCIAVQPDGIGYAYCWSSACACVCRICKPRCATRSDAFVCGLSYILTAATLCLITSFSVNASTERDLDSHVHSGATLNIAFGDNDLYVELDSPWMNLVGFEHEPSTDEQRASTAESVQHLQQGNELFTFVGTQCDMVDVVVENSMDSDHAEHSAVTISYVFNCAELKSLETVDVELFSAWPGIDDIDVQFAGPNGQNAMELDPDNKQIELTSVL